MVESLPADAEGTGSSPGLGRSRVPRSNWAREPQLLSLRVWSLCSATRAAATVRGPRIAMKSGPRLPRLGGALAQKRGPNTAKKKKKKKNRKGNQQRTNFLKNSPFCLPRNRATSQTEPPSNTRTIQSDLQSDFFRASTCAQLTTCRT